MLSKLNKILNEKQQCFADSKYIVNCGLSDFDSILPNYMFGIMLLRSSFVNQVNTDPLFRIAVRIMNDIKIT